MKGDVDALKGDEEALSATGALKGGLEALKGNEKATEMRR